MPSLRDLTIVHRLNAPTRAAATRRRRLRKGATAALLALAAAIALPGGSPRADSAPATPSREGPSPRVDLAGRHAVVVPGAPLPVGTSRADVWNEHGTRIVACAPVVTAPESSSSSVMSATSPSGPTLALTDAQVAKIAPSLGDSSRADSNLIVSGCL